MAEFPRASDEIIYLARRMVQGFKRNLALFPHAPVPWPLLQVRIYQASLRVKQIARYAGQLAAATAAREAARAALEAAIKRNLRYAERVTGGDAAQLALIGWQPRRAGTALAPPGQAQGLVIRRTAQDNLGLAWQPPAGGGQPAAYRLAGRTGGAGPWALVRTAVATGAELAHPERGLVLEFRVVAVNRAGSGPASNTVEIRL